MRIKIQFIAHENFPQDREIEFQDSPHTQTIICDIEHATICRVDFLGFILKRMEIVVETRQTHDIERSASDPMSDINACTRQLWG
jgi:hypothetical protein